MPRAIDYNACETRTLHTPADWEKHPYAGHGFESQLGWTHPDLKPQPKKDFDPAEPLAAKAIG